MKHFFKTTRSILVGLLLLTFHVEAGLKNYPKELSATIQKLERLPEARALIDEVQEKGPITIVYLDMPGQSLEGFWDATGRKIEVNRSAQQSEGRLISTILFELHNAQTSQRLIQITNMAKHNQISKEEFVSSVEKMEHRNALSTSHLLEKGISMGIFPKDASWPIYHQFEDHYKLQQVMSHSKWLADHYDRVNRSSPKERLKGTIPGLDRFTAQDKDDFLNYLAMKNDLESPFEEQRQRAFVALNKEYGRIESCYKGGSSGDCNRYTRKLELMELAFDKHPIFENLNKESGIASIK